MEFFLVLPTLGAWISEATGIVSAEDATNAVYMFVFLGIPAIILLVSMAAARGRRRRGENREGVATFLDEELDEMPADVTPEELCPFYAGDVNGRAVALEVLALWRDGALDLAPTASLDQGAWRIELLDTSAMASGGLRGAIAHLLFVDGGRVTSPAAIMLSAARSPQRVEGEYSSVKRCADQAAEERGLSLSTGRGTSGLLAAVAVVVAIIGAMSLSQTTLGIGAIAALIGGMFLVFLAQSNLGAERTIDTGADLIAGADAHRRWIIRRASSGQGISGMCERVDRTLRFALALGIDEKVVRALAHDAGAEELEWFLSPPREGWPSPLEAIGGVWDAVSYEVYRYRDTD